MENEIPTPDFEKILSEALLGQYESWDKNMNLWASDLGIALGPEHDGCPLRFWLLCRNEPRKELSAGQVLMFKIGDLIHDYIAEMLTDVLPDHGWQVVGVEQRVKNDTVSGRLDIKIRHEDTGTTRVIDIKTKRGGAFRWLDKEGAKPGNELQVQFYVDESDADEGDLLYVDREGQNFMRHFPVDKRDDRSNEAQRRLVQLRDGPRPSPLTAKLKRRNNKGADSIYLEYPWQVDWCDLQTCPCREAIGSLPNGIVAKLHETDDGVEVRVKDKHKDLTEQIVALLEQTYPEETFVTEEHE